MSACFVCDFKAFGGESNVIIIDQTVNLPSADSKFCGNLWINDFLQVDELPIKARE